MKRYLLFLLCLFSVSNPITSFAKTPGDEQVAITIAGEAWGEGRLGMYAVACVIQNNGAPWTGFASTSGIISVTVFVNYII